MTTHTTMTAAEFRAALATLGWEPADAARIMRVGGGRTRVHHWLSGSRRVPPYIAGQVETHLRLHRAGHAIAGGET